MKKTLTLLAVMLISSVVLIFPAPAIYQAENGTLSGGLNTTTYSGTQCVYYDGSPGDYCQVTVNVPSAGMYTITLRIASPSGPKTNDLYANGVYQTSVTDAQSTSFVTYTAGMVPLNAGNNTLRFTHNWGWMYLDWFGVEAATLPPLSVADTLVNTNSTQATKCLMSYLASQYGVKTISGQCGTADVTWINTATAKYPAIKGFDMMAYSPSRVAYGEPDPLEVESAIAWYQSGGIVQFQWHWNAPSGLYNDAGREWWRGFYEFASTFDVVYAMNNTGSQQYSDILRDIDAIAVQLKRLRDAGVPVIWRPLHEAQGGWFWWGAKRTHTEAEAAAACMALYNLVYDRLTNYHALNNLIWTWTSDDNANSASWYPGNTKVDIIGADIYLSGLDYSPSTTKFYNLVNLVAGQKMVAMTETGTIPDAQMMQDQHAHWLYFLTWNGYENNPAQNSLGHVQDVYNSSYIVKRADLGNIYNCVSPTNTRTNTFTATNTHTATFTYTVTQTATYTSTPSGTATHTATATFTNTQTASNTQTNTFTQTQTMTDTATNTYTNTIIPNTATHTYTQTPVFTYTNTYTQTVPLNTYTETHTVTYTETHVQTQTYTNTETQTMEPATFTHTVTGTWTSSYTQTPTNTYTAQPDTPTNTATSTWSPTNYPSSTYTMPCCDTATHTYTATFSATGTNTIIYSATFTFTPFITYTQTYTFTPTQTVIYTVTNTPVYTPTPEIKDPVFLYPNPADPASGKPINIKLITKQQCNQITFKLYTASFRLIEEIILLRNVPEGDYMSGVPGTKLKGLANGTYYYYVEYKGKETTRSKVSQLILINSK